MTRRTDVRRDSRPKGPRLFSNEEEKARLESRNVLLQFQEVLHLIDEATRRPSTFKLRPSLIQNLQRIAIQDIYNCAGNYRTVEMRIEESSHEPPPFTEVPQLVEDLCEYVNQNWNKSAIHLAAFIMWRINWVHPFAGGNGRTARAVSYLALCARLGYPLPGERTIPEEIVAGRGPYYRALDAADAAWKEGRLDVSQMEELLSNMLARQLFEVHQKAMKDETSNK